MAKTRYRPATALVANGDVKSLPIDRPVAVYYRQSTDGQVGNISTALQTVDMVKYLKQRGWKESDIIMIDMDAGVSGTKKIDERAGMRLLFEMISEQKIGAVACQDEDRLFRDVTQIQVNIFIEACRMARVLVLTPSIVYDFANELTGTFHARQFRFKSEMAAEYINSFIRGRLHRAKERLALEGRWTGGTMPPGYMVDTRKTLLDGSLNENWRRYVPFEPYAEVVNQYFRVFLETGGSLARTLRHIYEHGISYPDPMKCQPPDGFKVRYGIGRHGGGFFPGKNTLSALLVNAAYVGHWAVNGTIVRWNNHPAIVPEDIFWQVFNYLSEYTLEGQPNPDHRPFQEFARPLQEEDRPVERPLCAGMIFSKVKGRWHAVGTEYVKREKHYRFLFITTDVFEKYHWSKHADCIDDAVCKFLMRRLRKTFDSRKWGQSLEEYRAAFDREYNLKQSQLIALEQAMHNLVGNLESMTNPQMVRAAEVRYEEAQKEKRRLTAEVATMENEGEALKIVSALRDTYAPIVEKWDKVPRDDKRAFLHTFIDRIEAEPVDKHGLKLTIRYRDGEYNEVALARQASIGTKWTYDEAQRLLELIDAGATQVEIAAAFPDRIWRVIGDKINNLRDRKTATFTPKPIRDFETYPVYCERIAKNGGHHKTWHRWRKGETAELLEMLDNGATKLELAIAFPYRTWTRLRTKVSELKGSDFEIPGDMPMGYKESYDMYQQRIAKEVPDINSHESNMVKIQSSTTTA